MDQGRKILAEIAARHLHLEALETRNSTASTCRADAHDDEHDVSLVIRAEMPEGAGRVARQFVATAAEVRG